MRRAGRLASALIVVGALAASAPRRVEADAAAAEGRFFHERGTEAFRRGRYAEAVEHFLVAYRASPNPRALFNLAMAARRAGRDALAFTSFEELLEIDDDGERRAIAEAEREALRARLALVRVETSPPGATLYVGRRERGIAARAPALVPLAEDGEVTILAELEGHRRAQGTVTARRGETIALSLTLAPRVGRLVLEVTPSDAELVVDGAASEAGERALPVGRYTVRATAPGHRPASTRVEVREGETTRAALTLPALPRPTGRLLVDGAPGGTVTVDGRVVGTTPVALGVAVGAHEVAVPRDGFRRRVEVTATRPTYLRVRARR